MPKIDIDEFNKLANKVYKEFEPVTQAYNDLMLRMCFEGLSIELDFAANVVDGLATKSYKKAWKVKTFITKMLNKTDYDEVWECDRCRGIAKLYSTCNDLQKAMLDMYPELVLEDWFDYDTYSLYARKAYILEEKLGMEHTKF